MGMIRLWMVGIALLAFSGATSNARAASPKEICMLDLVPKEVLAKQFRDFLGDVTIALNSRPEAQAAAQEAFLQAVAGTIEVRINDELDRPFQAVVSYSIRDGRAEARFIGVAVSPSAALLLLRPSLERTPNLLSRRPEELEPALVSGWIDALAEMHRAIEFKTGRLPVERLNSWDQEVLARAWRGEPTDSRAVAEKLWPQAKAAHAAGDAGFAVVNFNLARGAELAAALNGLSGYRALQLANDLLRGATGTQAAALDRARALADLQQGDARAAFLRWGAQAALLFALENLEESLGNAPQFASLKHQANALFEEAYGDLVRHLDGEAVPVLAPPLLN